MNSNTNSRRFKSRKIAPKYSDIKKDRRMYGKTYRQIQIRVCPYTIDLISDI
jgi:hypothetical protein